jgi:hypothetical protein
MTRRRQQKKPKMLTSSSSVGLHPLLADRFLRVISHKGTGPIDLGLPKRGTLRPLLGSFDDASKSIVLTTFWSHDRTMKEWIDLISEYRKPLFETTFVLPSGQIHPFDTIRQGKEIEALFLQNQRMRWLARKFIAAVRYRIMSKRIVGDTDLYTTLTIPKEKLVKIFDVKTRSVYQFHVYTIEKILLQGLTYSSYGIPSPQIPKNPYTNIPWNKAQLVSITQQILGHCAYTCKIPNFILINFRQANFDTKKFYKLLQNYLNITAAVTFFQNKEDPESHLVFLETYDDFISYAYIVTPVATHYVRRLLEDKVCSPQLQQQWKTILTAFWIYQNHSTFWTWTSLATMVADFCILYKATLAAHRPRILSRLQTTTVTVSISLVPIDGAPNPQTIAADDSDADST